MTINEKVDPRKKNSDPANQSNANTADLDIFVLLNGPAKTLWSVTSVYQKQLVELVPVFDSEEHALSMLESFQEKSLQASKLSLQKLQSISDTKIFRFLLNPKVVLHDKSPFFKEGPNWHLTLEQLTGLLSPNKKRPPKT